MRSRKAPPEVPVKVFQLGQSGEQPGGMAQVINRMLTWSNGDFDVGPILSTRGRRDPLSPVLTARAAANLIAGARRGGVVVGHLSERGSFVREGGLLILAGLLGFGTVAQLHGAEFESFARAHPRLVRTVLGRAQVVAVLTDGARATTEELLGAAKAIRVVRNPVELSAETPVKAQIVAFAGEVGTRKGADLLVAAWRSLPAEVLSRWRLVVAGPVVDARIGAALRAAPSTTVLGPLPHEEVLGLLRTATVVALPSRAEALPMTILEAMAAGCAVLATSVGQIEDVVLDGTTGRVVPPSDEKAIAAALGDLLADEVRLATMGAAGRQLIADGYSSTAVKSVAYEIWRSALDGRPKRGSR